MEIRLSHKNSNDQTNSNKVRAHLNLNASSQIAADANVDKLVYTHFVRGDINKEASMKMIEKNYQGEVTGQDRTLAVKNIS